MQKAATGVWPTHYGSAVWPAIKSASTSSFYHYWHPADGALNPNGALVCTTSSNILIEVNKEVEKEWDCIK